MENKVLVRLIVPELDYTFDVFIPINELIWKIKRLVIKSISDLTGGAIDTNADYVFVNKTTSETYDNNEILANTNIRKGQK